MHAAHLRHELSEDDGSLPHATAGASAAVLVELLPDDKLASRTIEFPAVAEDARVQLAGVGEVLKVRKGTGRMPWL